MTAKTDTKYWITKEEQNTEPTTNNGSNNKQLINNNRTTSLGRTAAQATGWGS